MKVSELFYIKLFVIKLFQQKTIIKFRISKNIDNLISEIFVDININYQNKYYIRDRAIFTIKKIDVENINQQILDKISSKKHEFLSADSVEDKDQVDQSFYPVEFFKLHLNAIL